VIVRGADIPGDRERIHLVKEEYAGLVFACPQKPLLDALGASVKSVAG
jgi:hypothetical protein